MPDITPADWSAPWMLAATTDAQAEVMRTDLARWLKGEPHASFDAFRTLIQKIDRQPTELVEIGSGAGVYAAVLESINPAIRYIGFDIAPQQIDRAKQLFPGHEFNVGNCEDLPLPNDAADVVCLSAVIQHLPDYRQAIRESVRVASKWFLLHRVQATSGPTNEFVNSAYGTSLPTREVNESELLEFCATCGIELIEAVRWGNPKTKFNASFLFRKSTSGDAHNGS